PLQVERLGKDGQPVDDQQGAEARVMRKQREQQQQDQKTERGEKQTQRHDAPSQGRNVGAVGGFACPPHFEAAVREQEQVGKYRACELEHTEVRHTEDSCEIDKGEKARRFGNEITRGQTKDISEWARQLRAPLRLGIYHGPPEDLIDELSYSTMNFKCYSRRTRHYGGGAHPDTGALAARRSR